MPNKKNKDNLSDDERMKQVADILYEFYEDSVRLRLRTAGEYRVSESTIRKLTKYLIDEDIKNGISPMERAFGMAPEATKRDDKGRRILSLKGTTVTEIKYTGDNKLSTISMKYDIEDKKVQENRPDLVEWANAEREKIKNKKKGET